MMDTSDGLADALFKIAQSSGVEMEIEEELIPITPDIKDVADILGANHLDWVLFGGEDYTLVACVESDVADKLAVKNIPIRKIGKVAAKNPDGLVKVKSGNNEIIIDQEALEKKAFDHFN